MTQSGPTHDRTSASDARRSSMQHFLHKSIRVVRIINQTGSPGLTSESDVLVGRDRVTAGARKGVLGSADHLERLQTSRR